MNLNSKTKSVSSFPIKGFTVALVLTIALFIILGWQVWHSYNHARSAQMIYFPLQELSGIITHLDEVLTMSARMAAATGDLRWEKRYRAFEPKLDAAIKDAMKVVPVTVISKAAAQTNIANIKLVAMENRAFALVRQGRHEAAAALLSGKEYERQKRIYADGIQQIIGSLREQSRGALQEHRRQALLDAASVTVALPLLLGAWLSVLHLVRKHNTERKQAEEERSKLTRFPSENPNPVLRVAKDGTILYANNASLPLLDVWGCQIGQLLPDYWRKLILDVLGSGLNKDAEVVCGSYIFSLTLAPMVDEYYVNLYGLNITERKQAEEELRESEERYRTLFEESREAVFISTREGRIISFNQSALHLFAYTKEEMMKLNARPVYANPVDGNRFRQEIEQKGSVRDYELRLRKKDGTEMDCLVTATVRRSNDGSILGYQGIIRDITERRKMEEELLKIEKLESLGILAGGIAHDFNNILTAILGNISLARMYASDEERTSKRLAEAEKACLRAKDLTQQLLTFAKGGAPIKKTTSIAEIIKESASFALKGSNARCEFSIPEALWLVETDEGQISQVINNLIINADQAMPAGGIIKVGAENMAVVEEHGLPLKEGKYVKISIEDQGIGIPEEHLSDIFDPYFTTKHKGSGLGLATSYSIIKNHEGCITVESKLGVGTTFYLYLPASQKEPLTKKDIAEGPLAGKGRVLVMDDEEIIRDLTGELLSHLGYEVESARDGAEAIGLYKQAKAASRPFAVVIMDLTIPGGMGGKETMQKLLEIDPGVKAIVSSGYSNDPIMTDYRQYGFSAVVAKPYKVQELSKTLQAVMM